MTWTVLLLFLAGLLGARHSSVDAVEVFYVKPTTGPTTDSECPSGDSPCHSLQYYANHSSFTNNSRFLFLEGEHHLDSVVTISNVANLSLVGASPGVEIIGKSVPSGFQVEEFAVLNIENMALFNCSGFGNATLHLVTGLNVSLDNLTIGPLVDDNGSGITATNVVGLFSFVNTTFFSGIFVNYSLCIQPSYFNISGSRFHAELQVDVYCSDVQIQVTDSYYGIHSYLFIDLEVLTDNSVLVGNSEFNADVLVSTCLDSCSLQCSNNFVKFTKVTFKSSFILDLKYANCTALIEDSIFNFNYELILADLHLETQATVDLPIMVIFRNVTFADGMGGPPLARGVYFQSVAVLLTGCTFENNIGSALTTRESKVIFDGNHVFRNNSVPVGGGIQLLGSSYMYLRPHTHILFENNTADYVGGAIYTDTVAGGPCVFVIDPPTMNSTIEVNFIHNTAGYAGSSLYGHMESCCEDISCKHFYTIFNTSNTEQDPSAFASDPNHICFCEDGKRQPNCSDNNNVYNTHAFPGQDFSVRLAVVGFRIHGVVPGAVRAFIDKSSTNATIGSAQSSQVTNKPYCVDLNYAIMSTLEKTVGFRLVLEEHFITEMADSTTSNLLKITVNLKDCPLGFNLSHASGRCECDPRLDRNNVQCYINDQSFLRRANTWIGFINESSTASSTPGVMFHPNCPIGYCLPRDVSVTSNTSDRQCEPHRTGLLCGKCKAGYSLTLGNDKCAECSNTHLLLLLPLAVAGLLLVAVLFALNLTVTEGSINGLIFYANVIGMNHTVLFTEETSYLYTFLAWLNLDLGISTCLFNGMDGFAETWLQFVYPAYLWIIILIVIQLYSKFPTLANKLGGENAVKVLATLFLLSYTKLQRTVVTIMSFTRLEYPDGAVHYVWLYDANVEFFKGKHLYLGIAGILVLVFLIVPYTLCLAFFQQLQACSGHRLFQWVNNLKPVFDSYAGPYKDKYQFWTGMLLVVRTLLIILFTINTAGSVDVNLLIILVVSFALCMANSNGTYNKWPYNYLESFFYLQLGVFAGGVFYARLNHGSVTAVADTSIGLTLIVFLAVVGYHALHRVTFIRKCYYHFKGYADIEEEMPTPDHERLN